MVARTNKASANTIQGMEGQQAGKGKGISWMRLSAGVLLGIPAIVVLFPTFILICVTMLPSLVAFITDRQPGRHTALTVSLLNFCGALPSLVKLWAMGQSLSAAMVLMGDLMVWLTAYGAAATGWMILMLAVPVCQTYYVMITQSRLKQYRQRQEKLVHEWGQEVSGLTVTDDDPDRKTAEPS
ncbi:hypothetical protein [Fodinicurvata sediminis]|uniref:hypothetical protein n=1 Tax=Fodinicurvata sediminis TaxID=1121832 RepID=UPI0003B2F915|nr:hypothetical protein [Fodinicurvata sediminis]